VSEAEPLKFNNEPKIRQQMMRRGWTDDRIREAMQTVGIPTVGKNGAATRYVHPSTGKSVVVDNATGEVFHVGGEGFRYD
jgi:DNA transposition AAA+ family ATPase